IPTVKKYLPPSRRPAPSQHRRLLSHAHVPHDLHRHHLRVHEVAAAAAHESTTPPVAAAVVRVTGRESGAAGHCTSTSTPVGAGQRPATAGPRLCPVSTSYRRVGPGVGASCDGPSGEWSPGAASGASDSRRSGRRVWTQPQCAGVVARNSGCRGHSDQGRRRLGESSSVVFVPATPVFFFCLSGVLAMATHRRGDCGACGWAAGASAPDTPKAVAFGRGW
ncbi:unnamed protein product, partial [Urochloa humidicola]